MSKHELKLLLAVTWMGVLWAESLIDVNISTGKSDLKKAKKAYNLISRKLKLIENP